MEMSLREDQVKNAVGFLTNAKVISTPMENKCRFLRRKGLSDAEITESFKRADPSTQENQVQTVLQSLNSTSSVSVSSPTISNCPPKFDHTAALQNGTAYFVYPGPPPPLTPSLPATANIGWNRLILPSLGLLSLGMGIGYLAKKYLSGIRIHFSRNDDQPAPTNPAPAQSVSDDSVQLATAVSTMLRTQALEIKEALSGVTKAVNSLHTSQPSEDVASELQSLRSAILGNSSNGGKDPISTDLSANEISVSENKIQPIEDIINAPGVGTEHQQKALAALLSSTSDGTRKANSLNTQLLYINNILENPDKEHFRKLNTSNFRYIDRIQILPGAKEFLVAAGFQDTCGFLIFPAMRPDVAEDSQQMGLLKSAKGLLLKAIDSLKQADLTKTNEPVPDIITAEEETPHKDNLT